MAKGLARQDESLYPAAPSAIKLEYPPNFGSVLIYFDPYFERYVFSLVTKNNFFEKPTYESVLASLYELRDLVISAEIHQLSLPKLASGYANLDINIVFEHIRHVLDPLIKNIDWPVQTPYRTALTSICPKNPTSLSNMVLKTKNHQNLKKIDLKIYLF